MTRVRSSPHDYKQSVKTEEYRDNFEDIEPSPRCPDCKTFVGAEDDNCWKCGGDLCDH